jgi:hypothetical protein
MSTALTATTAVVIVVAVAPTAVATAVLVAWVFIAHKVHRLVAGVVLVAMLGPVFSVARRHMHVDGALLHDDPRLRHYHRLGDDDGLRIHDGRWRLGTYLYAAIHAGFDDATYSDVDTGLRLCGPCGASQWLSFTANDCFVILNSVMRQYYNAPSHPLADGPE